MTIKNSLRSQPDASGHFGSFGGRYVAETLMPLILELEKVYRAAKQDPEFDAEFTELLRSYVGRPNPLYYAGRLTEALRAEAPEVLDQARAPVHHRAEHVENADLEVAEILGH